MTVAVDVVTESIRAGVEDSYTFSHAGGTPQGVLLFASRSGDDVTMITAATYGGDALALTLVATVAGGEQGRTEVWFLGTSVPAGTQDVVITIISTMDDNIQLVCVTLTGDGDLEWVDRADSLNGSIADASRTPRSSDRHTMAFASMYTETNDATSLVSDANQTRLADHDYGNQSSVQDRQTAADTVDFTIGWSGDSGLKGMLALTIGQLSDHVTTPLFRSKGTDLNGIGGGQPGAPAGLAADDIMLLFCETSTGEAVTFTDAQGFVEVPDSPQDTGASGTRLTTFWKRAVGGDTMPTLADAGDHLNAVVAAYSGCKKTGDPWNVTAGSAVVSSTGTIPGDTTTKHGCLVVGVVANEFDTTIGVFTFRSHWLDDTLVERHDQNRSAGNGGGLAFVDGKKWKAGVYGATAISGTPNHRAAMSIALEPPATERVLVIAVGV